MSLSTIIEKVNIVYKVILVKNFHPKYGHKKLNRQNLKIPDWLV
jgi:hypothetical protein